MNRYCKRCERVTVDGHLWCQEIDCPAEEGYPVLVYGDHLGDLKVTKLMRVWRTAALYEAKRGTESVLLKVAHKGDDCEERLKREATVFHSLLERPSPPVAFLKSLLPRQRPTFLQILPPYPMASKRAYGEITFRGEKKIYSVFRYASGKFLSDVMLENPQIWHFEAAWIIITVADTLWPLASKNKCHLGLTPDVMLVDVDTEGHYRPLLLDLGFIIEGSEIQRIYNWPMLCEPAYTAPELQSSTYAKFASPAADVYSLGAIFFEMLAGKSLFEPKLQRDDHIRQAVKQYRGSLPVDRPELESAGVVKIVEQSIAPTGRFESVPKLAEALAAIYGRAPAEKQPVPRRLYVLVFVFLVLLVIALCALIGVLSP